jgi:integrase
MKGHVARKGIRWYAVSYDGTDPVTGREKRTWHAAGTGRADAERLAARLAAERNGRSDQVRSLTFGAYLIRQWLPGKQVVLAASTYAGYRRNVERHILPTLGRIALRRLQPHHLEALYASLLDQGSGGLAPKTMHEVHLVIRGALTDAVRRGLVTRNVALVAQAPRLRAIPKVEQRSWTIEELKAFLSAAAGHRLFAARWTAAFTGMRRNELLGLCWDDLDIAKGDPSVNRGLVAIGYEMHETCGKTANGRRRIDLDPTTFDVLHAWRQRQTIEQRGDAIHPACDLPDLRTHLAAAGVRVVRLHDLRHTHGTLLIAAGVPVKVVSERLGHATPTFTIETYQQVLSGMQADAARVFEQLIVPNLLPPPPRR